MARNREDYQLRGIESLSKKITVNSVTFQKKFFKLNMKTV